MKLFPKPWRCLMLSINVFVTELLESVHILFLYKKHIKNRDTLNNCAICDKEWNTR